MDTITLKEMAWCNERRQVPNLTTSKLADFVDQIGYEARQIWIKPVGIGTDERGYNCHPDSRISLSISKESLNMIKDLCVGDVQDPVR